MAELVGDGPGTETLPVKHSCGRLPVGCGTTNSNGVPRRTRRCSRSTLFGSRCPPTESGNTAPCDSGSRALRSRKISTSQSGTRSTRTLDFVFGRLINRPCPFTRISVLSMLIKWRSRSTFGQVRASASPMRQPVPRRKRTRSGKSACRANSLPSKIISHARHSSSVSARASCVEGVPVFPHLAPGCGASHRGGRRTRRFRT